MGCFCSKEFNERVAKQLEEEKAAKAAKKEAEAAKEFWTREEVADVMGRQCKTLPALEQKSAQLAVLRGKNWLFNPAPPLDPSLQKKLAAALPEQTTYTALVQDIVDAFIDAHVGLKKVYAGGQAARDERFRVFEAAIEAKIDALNTTLEDAKSCVRLACEHGEMETTITDIKFKVRERQRVQSTQKTTKAVSMQTNLFVVFDEEEAAAAAPVAPISSQAAKIRELKELLDAGAITEEEFAASKAKLLEAMTA